ncbi:MAG: hypothetical protein KJP23_09220 [Deltaproteobacteria bacterium]|nr:hypothetical protein [Deltaproteobacteria bacterium]
MAQQCRLIVTVEENVLQGGFGSAVLESLQQSRQNVRTHCIGIPDAFVEQGPQKFLRKKYGLNRDKIVRTVKRLTRCDSLPGDLNCAKLSCHIVGWQL